MAFVLYLIEVSVQQGGVFRDMEKLCNSDTLQMSQTFQKCCIYIMISRPDCLWITLGDNFSKICCHNVQNSLGKQHLTLEIGVSYKLL